MHQNKLHVIEVTSGLTVWRATDDFQWYAVGIVARSTREQFNLRAHATSVKLEDLMWKMP